MTTRVGRAPLLVPAPRGWAGREAVRGLRVRVTGDGALVVEHPSGHVEPRAKPGEVTRVVLVDDPGAVGLRRAGHSAGLAGADAYGVLLALAGDRPVLAVRLAEWVPAPAPLDARTARDVSGANALARALGKAVEPGDPAALARHAKDVRDALVSPSPARPVATLLLAVGALALAAWFVASAAGRATGAPRGAASGALGAIGALLLTCTWLGERVRASRPLPPPPGTAVAPAPAGPVPRGFLRARLYVSPDWLVLTDPEGREAWLPGPAQGGVTQAAVTTEAVVLDDAQGNGLAALPRAAWCGERGAEDALRTALTGAGLTVRDEPSNRAPGAWLSAPGLAGLDTAVLGGGREPRGFSDWAGLAGGALGAVVALGGLAVGEPLTVAGGALAALAAAYTWASDRAGARRDARTA